MMISITVVSHSIYDLINIFTAVCSATPEGIPVCGYTQGYLAHYLCIDPDPQSRYGFTAGPGPGLTCDTRGSTCATPYHHLEQWWLLSPLFTVVMVEPVMEEVVVEKKRWDL